ncbi:hypothetical protein OG555_32015 [Kribbella sp. NBC_01484]|uniref:hypothetical protein n=1 Tax=Kribbella sp. NBC_01484 TaxID=2903579 RepID=UPI002E366B07|nr:hypothetical protein [Kribbella sp. NBC_01484]
MFKGQAPVTSVRPTVPMPNQGTGGVIFYERVDYGGASGVDQDLGHAELHRALAERE